ncbi:MAG: MFS transporter [Promethearchaeota archaeon]|nr:MAG: MFS transporter [Candidatus Lokiarchaeota archaeon]
MSMATKRKNFSRFILIQVILIGILWAADRTFFFFESEFLNTYLDHVLNLPNVDFLIGIMVSLSAVVGLITNFVWGVLSDNTRSKWGRRRPYFLFGIIAGIGMMVYALSNNYWLCVFIDVIIIGVTSNAVSVSQRAIIPDTVELENRGRANGIIQAVSYFGLIIALAFFLLANEVFGVSTLEGTIITQEGHFFLLTSGGLIYLICSVIGFLFIRERAISELPPKKKFMEEMKELVDITQLREHKNFFKILLASTVFQAGIYSVLPFFIAYIFDLGLPTIELLIAIVIGFGILIPAAMFLGRLTDKYGRKKYFPIITFVISISYALMVFVTMGSEVNFILLVVLLPFVLIGLLGLDTIINAWAQDTLPEDKRGKFYGIFNIVYTVSQVIGSLLAGTFSVLYGRPAIFIVGAVIFLIAIPFFIYVKETLEK